MGYAQIAAVDLGSNSFRLEVGRVVDDQIYPLDTVKEPVRLASGLERGGGDPVEGVQHLDGAEVGDGEALEA